MPRHHGIFDEMALQKARERVKLLETILLKAADDMGTMYAADDQDCECNAFVLDGSCWHFEARLALKGSTK